ncbi:electron transport complex subunit RsxC [Cocleimonas sp. KMM 6892]|uniref:electron transport complex subunit RsxC n=1 Tax=unclassified Cocleimonas TaxID=2639732 RepID=UPI002DB6FF47|nr:MULTISPECIES: electron transport complex subunit RsxC [unclassified Cocleimonas]MEB8432337.1 electron transport complex subunit RsxC [Cocleimonas sp. KMM 6892]MEC4714577.1 electron transport complex subunit RsxC [Cocleimonas sp. KMM 6895]MEC4744609.1 electron transport complex subunit RsxC [Cocleimonas sp. KMM 6896]
MNASLLSNRSLAETTSIKLYKFHGGVHPPFHKKDSNQKPIESAGIPSKLIVPIHQHIGKSAEVVVNVGDLVKKGQLIAEKSDVISAAIHAPTSGTVTYIGEHSIPHPSGLAEICVIIETDGEDDWGHFKLPPIEDPDNTDSSVLLERIEQTGIVGLGGAVFPTSVKLASSGIKHIETLIINGAECEPYITCDDRLMQDRSADIVKGIQLLQALVKPQRCLIAIEDNKPEAIEAMRSATAELSNIEVVTIPTIYPSGGEKQLIEILTGKEVRSGGLPIELGLMCLNIGTSYSIYKAIYLGEPLISRIITVTGNGIQHPQNYEVLIGTPFSHLAEKAGGYTKMAENLIMGGPMMGFAIPDDAVPVIKATNCALFISATSLRESNPAFSNQPTLPCIRCGKCMEVCPVKLLPQQLYWHIRAKDFEKAEDHSLRDCIDCGCCSYVCPSHIPLVDYFRFGKSEIREQKIALEKADLSRQRHEFLLYRKERDKREREEKRAAHKAALQEKKAASKSDSTTGGQSTSPKADAIKAAMERAKAKKLARTESEKMDTKESDTKTVAKASTEEAE